MRRLSGADLALAVLAAIVLGAALAALAIRPSSLDERAGALAAELRCPTCAGLSVADSPARLATDMRTVIGERLAAGDSDDEVRAFFVARYGDWILLNPAARGLNLVLWAVPVALVVLGLGLIAWRSHARPASAVSRSARTPNRALAFVALTFVVAGLAVPVAFAVGPRLAGGEITGRAPGDTIDALADRVSADPTDAIARTELADALLTADRPGEAAEHYRAALEVEPDNVRALLGLATLLLRAERPDGAVPALDRVLRLVTDQPDALLLRGLAHYQLDGGASPRVRADLTQFVAVAPADPRVTMARSLLAEGTPPPATGAP